VAGEGERARPTARADFDDEVAGSEGRARDQLVG
jgi:hypothetical protein